MSLSRILFDCITTKLKVETLRLKEETVYTKKLLSEVSYLQHLKKNNLKNLILSKSVNLIESFSIVYIINICFLKANTMINISDIKGNVKLFYSSGSVNLTGKQKKRRSAAVSKLISLLIKKAKFVGKKPIALHLTNVTFHKILIIKKLKKYFFVKLIKSFNRVPYNGCRKKKLRRKKYSKIKK